VAENPDIFDRDTLARIGRLTLRARRVVEGIRSGAHRSPLHGASVEFAEHKEYTPGDELRHIDWKLFGKSDKYYVKRFEEETNLLAHLLIDTSASMGYGRALSTQQAWWRKLTRRGREAPDADSMDADMRRTKHDYATLLAASLAYLFINQGDAVGLFSFGNGNSSYLPPRTRASHLHTIMGRLASVRPEGEGHIAQALYDFAPRVERRGTIVLISDLLEDPESILKTMKNLRTQRNDVIVFQVLHSDELTFPYEDVSEFEDPEDRQQRLVADPREMREGYLEELKKFLEVVRHRCFEAQVDYMLLDTATPVSRALAEFVARRAATRRRR